MQFLYLNSDRMGAGEPELGRRLLAAFLRELAASEIPVDMIGCVNDGVRLTTADGEALEHLRTLQARGAVIASCGTCLDHLDLRDSLKIGQVGNMAQAVQLLATADRIIRPN